MPGEGPSSEGAVRGSPGKAGGGSQERRRSGPSPQHPLGATFPAPLPAGGSRRVPDTVPRPCPLQGAISESLCPGHRARLREGRKLSPSECSLGTPLPRPPAREENCLLPLKSGCWEDVELGPWAALSPLSPGSENIQQRGGDQTGRRCRFLGHVALDGGARRIPDAVSRRPSAGAELPSWHCLKVDFLS